MKVILTVLAVTAALLWCPLEVVGQSVRSQIELAARQNWYLRASSNGQILASGRIKSNDSSSVSLGSTVVQISSITDLDRRLNIGGGWKVGGILGAVGLGWFGYEISGMCEGECRNERILGLAGGVGVGFVLGAVLGQAVHPAKHGWERLWP